MSSILDALKKIEKEKPLDGGRALAWPNSVQSVRKSIQFKNRLPLGIALMTGAGLVLAAGLFFAGSHTGFSDHQEPGPKTLQTGHATDAFKTSEREAEPFLPKDESAPPRPPTAISDTADDIINEQVASEPQATPEIEPREKENAASGEKKRGNVPEIDTDPRLNIQAIAWAQDPSRRFVVINNSILKEGGSIEGITVVTIGDNMVHFSENGKEWRQRFVIR